MKNADKARFAPIITAAIFTVALALAACSKPVVEAVYVSMDADTETVWLGQYERSGGNWRKVSNTR